MRNLVLPWLGVLLLGACGDRFANFDGIVRGDAPSEDELDTNDVAVLDNATSYLTTPTYGGTGLAVHPDVVSFPAGWNGYKYWMAMTPYPNDQFENPSILVSNDGIDWSVPPGLTNPLVGVPPCDHLNDTDIIYNAQADQLWVYYLDTRRAHRCKGHETESYYDHNYLKLLKSPDGVHWTGPETLIDWDLDRQALQLSPSVVVTDDGSFYLWVTDGATIVTRYTSSDGQRWHSPQKVSLAAATWHLNVSWTASESQYWMLGLDTKEDGILYWATSDDGLVWQRYSRPVLHSAATGAWDENLYRGGFVYEGDTGQQRLWYSAFAWSGDRQMWHIGYVSTHYSDFIGQLSESPVLMPH